jgi:tRNA U55 pseudouridine synthase TruB
VDIARKLGTCGVVVELFRSRVGPFKSELSISLEDLDASKDLLLPLNFALSHMQSLELDEASLSGIKFGKKVLVGSANSDLIIACAKSIPVAVGNIDKGIFHPKKVLIG